MKDSTDKKYDTDEKRIKFLRARGNIITFKEKFYPRGTANLCRLQIIVCSIEKARNGSVKISGSFYDNNWYNSMEELIDAIDWEEIEQMHA